MSCAIIFNSTAPAETNSAASARTSCSGLLLNEPLIAGMVQKEHFIKGFTHMDNGSINPFTKELKIPNEIIEFIDTH